LIYWTKSGNTEKVAKSIKEGLEEAKYDVDYRRVKEADELEFFDYDLFCLGFPSYSWHTPEQVTNFLKKHLRKYRSEGKIKLSSPRIPGKYALIFCTYSGPHTGIDEATPAVKYAGQFFDHVGISVVAEWCVLSEFVGWEQGNLYGRMGDIRGKPTEEELHKIKQDTISLVKSLRNP
jgi:flavorubredoxin